ncbi:AAA family ATPase [Priestia aryabhattai]|uniref:AAA family ATPase n=1 Tax=Priestia aryabhattai TaxID=412384 RepID=A0AAX6NEC5_PRIAR|nr:AAA family ATPase [Priestia aryabhattai]MDU9694086.1 AAA family ATPase [Priestia aryabhattai]
MSLQRVSLLREKIKTFNEYPFSVPTIKNLNEIQFKKNVTFFVGENGSGKSTLLESIAVNCGFNLNGGSRNNVYTSNTDETTLSSYLRLSWLPKVTNGFFLRAESFYNFATYLEELNEEVEEDVFRPYGGKSLHKQSHGESFLSLFNNRFNGRSALYLLDEPEAALSPARQLSLLKIIHDLSTKTNTQFIIATHSPILLGYPDATILSFDGEQIEETRYEMTEHYQITKYFLENPKGMLRELFKED